MITGFLQIKITFLQARMLNTGRYWNLKNLYCQWKCLNVHVLTSIHIISEFWTQLGCFWGNPKGSQFPYFFFFFKCFISFRLFEIFWSQDPRCKWLWNCSEKIKVNTAPCNVIFFLRYHLPNTFNAALTLLSRQFHNHSHLESCDPNTGTLSGTWCYKLKYLD